jgi:hypothetical protein
MDATSDDMRDNAPPGPGGRSREYALLALVALAAIAANLPGDLLAQFGIKPDYLVALLGFLVVLALFLYLRFFFFLLYVLLAIGANVPEQWAAALGISQVPLLVTLVAMVGLSLLNYGVKLLPTGLDASAPVQKPSSEGSKALFAVIERGNLQHLKSILAMGIDPNFADDAGTTPLMLAARLGHADIVAALLAAGAEANAATAEGRTARDLALRNGHAEVVKLLTPPTE